jgi:hypothetical protein
VTYTRQIVEAPLGSSVADAADDAATAGIAAGAVGTAAGVDGSSSQPTAKRDATRREIARFIVAPRLLGGADTTSAHRRAPTASVEPNRATVTKS